MAKAEPHNPTAKPRVRRKHTKSRQGCCNCKLRRVKCDETRPHCQKCDYYGVVCSYVPNSGRELQLAQEMEVKTPHSVDTTVSFELDPACGKWLQWFRSAQTSVTIMNVPQDEILRLAFSHPFLMHIVLTMSAMHHRHLSPSDSPHSTPFEVVHMSQCVKLLSQKISQPLQPEDRDALWITATLLGIVVFSSMSADNPEELWPLKSEPSDLEWVRMTGNKMALWTLTDPMRPNSLFEGMMEEYVEMFQPVTTRGTDGIPDTLVRLCQLDGSSTAENNPYFTAVHTLLPLLGPSSEGSSRARILAFTSQMTPAFRQLLEKKDPVALLLLALWYDVARRGIWWTRHRGTMEPQSIRLYLWRYHPQLERLQNILPEIDSYLGRLDLVK